VRVDDHLISELAKGFKYKEPWPHVCFENLLPWDYYYTFLGNWPDLQDFNWHELVHPDQLRTDGTYGRKQQEVRAYFPELADTLQSEEFAHYVFNMLDYPAPDPSYPMALLIDDEPGYWIRPHPDTPTKIATMQIYLPETNEHPEMGTSMIAQRKDKAPHRVPYLPNSGYAFKVSPHSWHEVESGQCHHRRRSIQVIWYNSPNPGIRYK